MTFTVCAARLQALGPCCQHGQKQIDRPLQLLGKLRKAQDVHQFLRRNCWQLEKNYMTACKRLEKQFRSPGSAAFVSGSGAYYTQGSHCSALFTYPPFLLEVTLCLTSLWS